VAKTDNLKTMNDLPAINELKKFENSEMTKDKIFNWVRKHNRLFNSFKNYPKSRRRRLFYDCYTNLFDLYQVINMEEETAQALNEFKNVNLNDELQLLKWLVDYEYLKYNFGTLCGSTITEESLASGTGQIPEGINAYFRIELIQNSIDIDTVFEKYYRTMYKKYDTFTEEENDAIIPFDDNYNEITSLRYHLEKGGITFNHYIKRKKNS
jgi:hypothetical protein